jgi:hypothetical protein
LRNIINNHKEKKKAITTINLRTLGHDQEIIPKNPQGKGIEIQTKDKVNLFYKIIPEKFPNLQKDMDIKLYGAFTNPNKYD